MINIFKKLFNKNKSKKNNETEKFKEIELLKKYTFNDYCNQCQFQKSCNKECENWQINFDKNKKTFIIVDDNSGIISLIKHYLEELSNEEKINLNEWNIISFTGEQTGIFFLKFLYKHKIENLKAALIDITYGNILRIDNINIKVNGIQLAYIMSTKYKNVKFYFYTGNTLNKYVKSQKLIRDFYKKFFNKEIDEKIINKINTSEEELKEKLLELLKDNNDNN